MPTYKSRLAQHSRNIRILPSFSYNFDMDSKIIKISWLKVKLNAIKHSIYIEEEGLYDTVSG